MKLKISQSFSVLFLHVLQVSHFNNSSKLANPISSVFSGTVYNLFTHFQKRNTCHNTFFLLLTHYHSLLSLSSMLGAKGDLLKPVDKVCLLQWSNWKSINRHKERKWNIFINTGEMYCWIWDKSLPDDYLNLLYLD